MKKLLLRNTAVLKVGTHHDAHLFVWLLRAVTRQKLALNDLIHEHAKIFFVHEGGFQVPNGVTLCLIVDRLQKDVVAVVAHHGSHALHVLACNEHCDGKVASLHEEALQVGLPPNDLLIRNDVVQNNEGSDALVFVAILGNRLFLSIDEPLQDILPQSLYNVALGDYFFPVSEGWVET